MCTEGFRPPADELRAWLRLNHTDGIGPGRGRTLLQALGPPEAILEAGIGTVADVLQSRVLAGALFRDDLERDAVVRGAMEWLQAEAGFEAPSNALPVARSILVLADPLYPSRLLDLADPPLLIYCTGDPRWLHRPQIGIVGSRNGTALGARTALELAAALAAAGWSVTSGLAEGIDQAAHEGALIGWGSGMDQPAQEATLSIQRGSTVAALGTGIDRIYPSRHRRLAQRIGVHGALLSEQPIGMPPLPANFPRRNRLIAALASGVLVVEANLRSGSLITARLAAELGREVMAVPGSLHSPLARGGNALIRQGAKLVESAGDILTELPAIRQLELRFAIDSALGPDSMRAVPPAPLTRATRPRELAGGTDLPEVQARMLAAMSADPVGLETLAARQRLTASQALAALNTLELYGLVARQLDGSYVRCPPPGGAEQPVPIAARNRFS
ncbi:MAG TPA: DNA-processing protein DprA [Lautropia sp.]|nr:DNA-processing protein DprA [Lautropia sp.]